MGGIIFPDQLKLRFFDKKFLVFKDVFMTNKDTGKFEKVTPIIQDKIDSNKHIIPQ